MKTAILFLIAALACGPLHAKDPAQAEFESIWSEAINLAIAKYASYGNPDSVLTKEAAKLQEKAKLEGAAIYVDPLSVLYYAEQAAKKLDLTPRSVPDEATTLLRLEKRRSEYFGLGNDGKPHEAVKARGPVEESIGALEAKLRETQRELASLKEANNTLLKEAIKQRDAEWTKVFEREVKAALNIATQWKVAYDQLLSAYNSISLQQAQYTSPDPELTRSQEEALRRVEHHLYNLNIQAEQASWDRFHNR